MIEVKIPQEINQYDAKLIGPFTMRQAICGGCAALISYLVYHYLSDTLPQDAVIGIILLIAVPFALIGWIKPYGQRFEQFFVGVLYNTLISSSRRVFRSENPVCGVKPHGTGEKTPTADNCKKAQKRYRRKTFL